VALAVADGVGEADGVSLATAVAVTVGVGAGPRDAAVATGLGLVLGDGVAVGASVAAGVGVGVSVGGGGVRISEVTVYAGEPSSDGTIFPIIAQSPTSWLICRSSVSSEVDVTKAVMAARSPQPGSCRSTIIDCASTESGNSFAVVVTLETSPDIWLSAIVALHA
jgi:hypothetical protein